LTGGLISYLQGYWNNIENQKGYLEKLAEELNIKQMEDRYNIKVKLITAKGGASLLSKYGSSPSKLLATIYPQHQLEMSKFETDWFKNWMTVSNVGSTNLDNKK
jgi:hypothetical protein